MKIIEPGYVYQLQHLDGSSAGTLAFVNREPGREPGPGHEGTQAQEILRALIDHTKHCDARLRREDNDKIIEHLHMALALYEARAPERTIEKGEPQPVTAEEPTSRADFECTCPTDFECTCPTDFECTCPTDSSNMRDKDCTRHGLATLTLAPQLRQFRYGDGIVVLAENEAAADLLHVRMLAWRNRS